MKKILVDCCRNCPLKEMDFDERRNPFSRCTHVATKSRRLDHLDIIPDWCVLEDD